jgi:hypothetical protein
MIIKGDKVIFTTGREEYANNGIIGLTPKLTVMEGYDGYFYEPQEDWMDEEDYDGITNEEQIELADYMIEKWQKFKSIAEENIKGGK